MTSPDWAWKAETRDEVRTTRLTVGVAAAALRRLTVASTTLPTTLS